NSSNNNDQLDPNNIEKLVYIFFNNFKEIINKKESIFNNYYFYCIIHKFIKLTNIIKNQNNSNFIDEIIEILNNNNESISSLLVKSLSLELDNNSTKNFTDNNFSSYSVLNKNLKLILSVLKYYNNGGYRNENIYKFIKNYIILCNNNQIIKKILNFDINSQILNNLDIPSLFVKSKTGQSIIICKIYIIVLEIIKFILLNYNNNSLSSIFSIQNNNNSDNNNNNNNKFNDSNEIIYKFGYLFINQDDIAIETINSLLTVYNEVSNIKDNSNSDGNIDSNNNYKIINNNLILLKNLFVNSFNPHNIFCFFIKEICFYDHLIIIDMLISNETTFLNYFLNYLKLTSTLSTADIFSHREDKEEFISCLSLLYNSIETSNNNNIFPYNPKILLLKLEMYLNKLKTINKQK
ncbi:hypothetical protein DICPUDRAFT_79929, partial [Dictyostelium purpureum]